MSKFADYGADNVCGDSHCFPLGLHDRDGFAKATLKMKRSPQINAKSIFTVAIVAGSLMGATVVR